MKRLFFEFQTLKLEILRGIQTRLLECYMLINSVYKGDGISFVNFDFFFV